MSWQEEVSVTINEEFESVIWKIELDSRYNLLAIETRDAGKHIATISAFNYLTRECYFKQVRIENNWHWHLDRVYRDLVLLHGYVAESSPEHKGIVAVDVKTGQIKWQVFHLALTDVSAEGIIAFNPLFQSKKLILLNPENGEPFKDFEGEFTPVKQDISFPRITHELPDKLSCFQQNIKGMISYAEINSKDCYSFHAEENGLFTQYLIILKGSEVLKKEILASGIQKLNPEAFFTSGHFVFAVKGNNHQVLTCLL